MNITFYQENIEYFLLILVRMTAFVSIAPFFGHTNVPIRLKVGVSAVLSLVVYGLLSDHVATYDNVWEYAALIFMEAACGLLIGLSAFICMQIISFAGRMIDMEGGLSMATIYDPLTRDEVSISGSLYNYAVLFLLLTSNMQYFLLSALVDSYTLIPIGGESFDESLYTLFIGFVSDYFVIGLRIMLPFFAVSLIMNSVMGVMTKVAPSIHMFSVGIQLKVLAVMLVMLLTVVLLPTIAEYIFDLMQQMVVYTIRGMY